MVLFACATHVPVNPEEPGCALPGMVNVHEQHVSAGAVRASAARGTT